MKKEEGRIYENVTEVFLSPFPEDHLDHFTYGVRIKYRRNGLYAVTHFGFALEPGGEWVYPETPDCWCDFDAARDRACAALLDVTVNGTSARQILEEDARERIDP